jgi:hypothetical protein
MKLRQLVFAALFAALVGGVAGVVRADTKYLVNHKGDWICVDDDSLGGHLGHGDYTLYEIC